MENQDEMEEVIKEFLVESFENLDKLDQDLVTLESQPGNKDVLNRIFRIIHTIKGTSGFFGFSKLESIAHSGENLLDGLRSDKIVPSAEITTALLKTVDAVRDILTSVHNTKAEGDVNYDDLVKTLKGLASGAGKSAPVKPAVDVPVVSPVEAPPTITTVAVIEPAVVAPPVLEHVADSPQVESNIEEKTSLTAKNLEAQVPEKNLAKAPIAPEPEAKHASVTETSLRVDVHLIDDLMNLVSELVLARNQILQFSKTLNDSGLSSTTQRLNVITSELQESVMRTRMQPIENVWNKFPRVIRDVAQACKKEARIEMEGKDTELDKTIIEAIKDPLTHIIRNSVDHGLELPEVRKAKGKDPVGTVKLKAFHEGGYVIIEIIDDGAGLNIERIKTKAQEKGLISADYAKRMSDREAAKLIFAPGFSTAEQITNISGRGVGMDVVRSNIERIGGVVDVLTVANLGTTIRIKIPLTLAIVPALLVNSAGQRFAIPQVSLVELVRLPIEHIDREVEKIGEAHFIRLRGRLMPLVYLCQALKMRNGECWQASLGNRQSLNIIFVQVEGRQFGLVVDSVSDTEEIVVKPLSRQLKEIPVYAGAAIMGDGKIALILDVAGLSKHTGVFSNSDQELAKDSTDSEQSLKVKPKRRMLIVNAGSGTRVAIPVERLNRLEEFEAERFESAAGQRCIQYREGILPLIHVGEFLGRGNSPERGTVKAVILDNQVMQIGLVVESVVDIVEESFSLTKVSVGSGIVGSAIVAGHITDFLDLGSLFSSVKLGSVEENIGEVI
jgi:two-component system chemotaxis sensor kinase CheA